MLSICRSIYLSIMHLRITWYICHTTVGTFNAFAAHRTFARLWHLCQSIIYNWQNLSCLNISDILHSLKVSTRHIGLIGLKKLTLTTAIICTHIHAMIFLKCVMVRGGSEFCYHSNNTDDKSWLYRSQPHKENYSIIAPFHSHVCINKWMQSAFESANKNVRSQKKNHRRNALIR